MKKIFYTLLTILNLFVINLFIINLNIEATGSGCDTTKVLTYLLWDNSTEASLSDIELDPLLVLRTSPRYSDHSHSLQMAWQRAAKLASINLYEEDTLDQTVAFENIASSNIAPPRIANNDNIFDLTPPMFYLDIEGICEKVWWQISIKPDFSDIPSSFDSVQKYDATIKLSDLDETLLIPGRYYYFRAKTYSNGSWSPWSELFPFSSAKPDPAENIRIEKKANSSFELCWEGSNTPGTSYYVFASNSLDFIPSIYSSIQPDMLLGSEIVEASASDNFLGETTGESWSVDGNFAYYRVIVQRNGRLSTPSPIILFWENGKMTTGNVLKLELSEDSLDADIHFQISRRVALPDTYSWIHSRNLNLYSDGFQKYLQNHYVTQHVWETLQPYFLPENHPVKRVLDLAFHKQRALKSLSTLKKAGFKPVRKPQNNLVVARHSKMEGYLIKAYLDKVDEDECYWFLRRAAGARQVQQCIDRHGYNSIMKAPQKWIYPLPPEPSPDHSRKVWRKDFILIVEDVKPLKYRKNKAAYKKRVTPEILDALYTVFTENLLVDSFYLPNISFCKDGRIAFLDTEFFNDHSKPLKLWKLAQYLSSDMHAYWDQLIQYGIQ